MFAAVVALIVVHFALVLYVVVLLADVKNTLDDRLNEALSALLHVKGERVAAHSLVPPAPRKPVAEHERPGYMQPRQVGLNGR